LHDITYSLAPLRFVGKEEEDVGGEETRLGRSPEEMTGDERR
jgi:hypothetical protein